MAKQYDLLSSTQTYDNLVFSGSQDFLVEPGGGSVYKKKKWRFICGIVATIVIAAVVVGIVLGINNSKAGEDDTSGHVQGQGGTEGTTEQPRTTQPSTAEPTSSHTKSSEPTTQSKTDWLSEPCHDNNNLPTCPWSSTPLLLVSLDGFRAEYLTRNVTPAIGKLRQCGVHTPYMRAAYPTLTFPNHYTIVTGLYPESHGIVGNSMYDPYLNESFSMSGSEKFNSHWWGGEPFWVTAKKQGKKTASYYWVGSEMNISGHQPDIWFPYGNVPFEERVDTVLEWLEREEGDRPDFITLYMDEPDHTGHGAGPVSPEVDSMLGRVDSVLRYLMDGLRARHLDHCVNLIVLADHGMESVSSERVVSLDYYQPEVKNMLAYQGTTGYIHRRYSKSGSVVHKVEHPMTADTLLDSLECKNPHLNMFSRDNIPVRHHYTRNDRIGDVLVDIEASWLFSAGTYHNSLKGNHGYDNIYKSMHALFLAHGPDFKQEYEAEPFENIELYNLMSDLLHIKPAPNNGTTGSLYHMMRTPPSGDNPGEPLVSCSGSSASRSAGVEVPVVFDETTVFPFGVAITDPSGSLCVQQSAGVATVTGRWSHLPTLAAFNLHTPKSRATACTPVCSNGSCSIMTDSEKNVGPACLFSTGDAMTDLERESITVPMLEGFKTGIWAFLGNLVHDYGKTYGHVNMVSGAIFDHNNDGLADTQLDIKRYVNADKVVPLPSHYYAILTRCSSPGVKVDKCEAGDLQVVSIILPHQNKSANCLPNKAYLLNNVARVRDVELLTGSQFFTTLNKATGAKLRTFLPDALWESQLLTPWRDLPCPIPNDPKCPSGTKPLLLISLDGFRAEYLGRRLTPVMQRLSQCGVHTPYMRASYPTVTFPNHYTIVTGLYPESHGVIGNTMYDADIGQLFTLSAPTSSDPRWWKGEPLWITAKNQGKKSATYFWPGSDVNISGVYPDIWKKYDGKAGYTARVYEVLEWLSRPAETRPDLVTLYFDEPDHAGHSKGPDSDMVNGMLETVDELIDILMTNLYDRGLHNCVNVIIVADHGMSAQSCERTVKVDQYLPEVNQMFSIDHTLGHLFPQFQQLNRSTIVTQSNTINVDEIVAKLTCKDAAMKVFTKETLPRRHHYTNNDRIGDVLLDMKDSWLVLTRTTTFCDGGNHGWDNTYKNMHALFLAHGPAFKDNFTAEPFENIELYNLMTEVLGIEPAPNNGTPGSLHYILRDPQPLPTAPPFLAEKCTPPAVLIHACNCPDIKVNTTQVYSENGNVLYGEPRGVNQSFCTAHLGGGASVGLSQELSDPVWVSTIVRNTTFPLFGEGPSSCILGTSDTKAQPGVCSFSQDNQTLELTPLLGTGTHVDNNIIHTLATSLPLYKGFKEGVWLFVNNIIRDYTNLYGDLGIISGPIYDYNNDGLWEGRTNQTLYADEGMKYPIPTHVYVIVTKCRSHVDLMPCTGPLDTMSFIIPHLPQIPNCLRAHEYLRDNVGRIRDIELLTGLVFMTSYDVTSAVHLRTFLPEDLWKSSLIRDWMEFPCPHEDKCTTDYRPVILISLDGFRADYLLRNVTPTISRLSQCGVHAPYMRSVYPTKTFPNHYSIVTGLYPESHGIIDNNMYDLDIKERFYLGSKTSFDPRWWGGEPIWLTAARQGQKAATYFWPGSDVNITGQYPNLWKKYDGSVSYTARVRELLAWLQLPIDQRPSFLTLYFDQPDLAGHKNGPSNEEQIAVALQQVDSTIHELLTGLVDQNIHNCVNLVVIADHGMADVTCQNVVRLKNYVDYDYLSANTYVWEGPFGRIANRYIYNGTVKDVTPATSLALMDGLLSNLTCADPHLHVYSKASLPVRHHYSNNDRIDDTILDLDSGYLVTRSFINTCKGGNHGYDNLDKSMEALFLAYGPAFKWNLTVDPFENIELYNMFTDILNITAAPNNGTVGSLDHILQRPPVRASKPDPETKLPDRLYGSDMDYSTYVKSSPCFQGCSDVTEKMLGDLFDNSVKGFTGSREKHLPFGIPRLSVADIEQTMFIQESYVAGMLKEQASAAWISQTLSHSKINNRTTDCILPDPRVDQTRFEAADVCNPATGNRTVHLVLGEKSPDVDSRLSTVVYQMHETFVTKVWQPLLTLLDRYLQTYGEMNVITGPVYDSNHDSHPDSLLANSKRQTPSHFYVVLTRCAEVGGTINGCERYMSASYILPHSPNVTVCQGFDNYLVDNEARVRDVEIATGLELYTSLPRQQAIRLRTFLPSGLWTV